MDCVKGLTFPKRKPLVARWRAADGNASGPLEADTSELSASGNIGETKTPAVRQRATRGKR